MQIKSSEKRGVLRKFVDANRAEWYNKDNLNPVTGDGQGMKKQIKNRKPMRSEERRVGKECP